MTTKNETLNYSTLIRGVDGALEFFLLKDELVRSFLFKRGTEEVVDHDEALLMEDKQNLERWFSAKDIRYVFDINDTSVMAAKIDARNKKVYQIEKENGATVKALLVNRKALCELLIKMVASKKTAASKRLTAFKEWLFENLLEKITMLEMENLEMRSQLKEERRLQKEIKELSEYYNRHVEQHPEVISMRNKIERLEGHVDLMQRIHVDERLDQMEKSGLIIREVAKKRRIELEFAEKQVEVMKVLTGRETSINRQDMLLLSDVVKLVHGTHECTQEDFYETLEALGYIARGKYVYRILPPMTTYIAMFKNELCIKKSFTEKLYKHLQLYMGVPEKCNYPEGFSMVKQSNWIQALYLKCLTQKEKT